MRPLALFATLLLACDVPPNKPTVAAVSARLEPPAPEPTPAATPVPIAPVRVVEVRAVLEPSKRPGVRRGSLDVFVVAPEIDLRELVAEVRPPYWCQASARPSYMAISCTPEFREDAAQIFLREEPPSIHIKRGKDLSVQKDVPVPRSVRLEFIGAELEARAAIDGPCPADGPRKRVDLRVDVRHAPIWEGREKDGSMSLGPPLFPDRIVLIRVINPYRCSAKILRPTELDIDCSADIPEPHASVRVDGDALQLHTTQAYSSSGRVSLPCGSDVRLHEAEMHDGF